MMIYYDHDDSMMICFADVLQYTLMMMMMMMMMYHAIRSYTMIQHEKISNIVV